MVRFLKVFLGALAVLAVVNCAGRVDIKAPYDKMVKEKVSASDAPSSSSGINQNGDSIEIAQSEVPQEPRAERAQIQSGKAPPESKVWPRDPESFDDAVRRIFLVVGGDRRILSQADLAKAYSGKYNLSQIQLNHWDRVSVDSQLSSPKFQRVSVHIISKLPVLGSLEGNLKCSASVSAEEDRGFEFSSAGNIPVSVLVQDSKSAAKIESDNFGVYVSKLPRDNTTCEARKSANQYVLFSNNLADTLVSSSGNAEGFVTHRIIEGDQVVTFTVFKEGPLPNSFEIHQYETRMKGYQSYDIYTFTKKKRSGKKK